MCIVLCIEGSAKFGVAVFKASMLNWWEDMCHGYMCIVLYIYKSAKFGVVVCKASMLDWLGGPSAIGICALFCHEMCQVWYSGIQGIYASVTGGGQFAMGLYALLYIYIYIVV